MSDVSPLRAMGARDAREALSAALLAQTNKREQPEGSKRLLVSEEPTGDEGAAKVGQAFKKLRTGKGWNEAAWEEEYEERERVEREAERRAWEEERRAREEERRERAALEIARKAAGEMEVEGGEVDDGRAVGNTKEGAVVATSKMQLLKNRMRQSSRSNIMSGSDAAAVTVPSRVVTVDEGVERGAKRGSPRRSADGRGTPEGERDDGAGRGWTGKGMRGGRGRAEKVQEPPAPVRPTARSPLLGQHPSAFFSYHHSAAAGEREGEHFRGDGVFDGGELVDRHRPGSASHISHVLKQRQVCWQGNVKHKLKDSMVELFHLAAAIPADLAEQFPPSLYVSELRHRSEVTLSNCTWVQCASRSLTEKQTAKLQLLSDNKLVAIVRLQHCELILLPDFEPSSGSVRMTCFLMAERIYAR